MACVLVASLFVDSLVGSLLHLSEVGSETPMLRQILHSGSLCPSRISFLCGSEMISSIDRPSRALSLSLSGKLEQALETIRDFGLAGQSGGRCFMI